MSRKLRFAALATCLALLEAVSAVATGPAAGNKSVTGTWISQWPYWQQVHELNAIEHRDGTVTGTFSFRILPYTEGVSGNVDCLEVIGNQAYVSGIITAPSIWAGYPFMVRVTDNGEGAGAPRDSMTNVWVEANPINPPLSCHEAAYRQQLAYWQLLVYRGDFAVVEGNIQVRGG